MNLVIVFEKDKESTRRLGKRFLHSNQSISRLLSIPEDNKAIVSQHDSIHRLKLIKASPAYTFYRYLLNVIDYEKRTEYMIASSRHNVTLLVKLNQGFVSFYFVELTPLDHIIRAWSSIVLCWLTRRICYEAHWAYYSTFGGAYSSLGEDELSFAHNASQVSLQQLRLAIAFNDPNIICRCKIFLAHSFIQLGRFALARRILK